MSGLKIGFVLDDSLDKTDGVQQYVLTLGKWLGTQGHEVHYLVGQTARHDLPRIHSLSKNIAVRFNGNRMSMPLPAKKDAIRRRLRDDMYDVLHVQLPYSPFMAQRVIMAANPGMAIIGTFHVFPDSRLVQAASKLLAIWLKPTLPQFDRVISVSPAAAGFAYQTFGLHTDVIPNVIEYGVFHDAKPLPQYDDTVITVMFLGRLVPRKGCIALLRAINSLVHSTRQLPPLRVVICGKGPLEASLKRYCHENGLSKYVEFTGFIEDAIKPRYYASADIAVFPSSGGESFGIVLLEAMASGKAAVLAGDNPGYRSVMGEDNNLLFNPMDYEGLAEKLAVLLTNGQRRREAARWGADHARQFDVATVGKQLLAVYKQALRLRRDMR